MKASGKATTAQRRAVVSALIDEILRRPPTRDWDDVPSRFAAIAVEIIDAPTRIHLLERSCSTPITKKRTVS